MLQRLSIGQFLGCVIDELERRTGVPCHYDPEGMPSPFFSVQLVKTEPANTKTMFIDRFEVWVHAISEPTKPYSPAKALELVQRLEEAMTEDIELPEPFSLFRQECGGLQTLKRDPTDEGHAVISYSFHVCYGLRCK